MLSTRFIQSKISVLKEALQFQSISKAINLKHKKTKACNRRFAGFGLKVAFSLARIIDTDATSIQLQNCRCYMFLT